MAFASSLGDTRRMSIATGLTSLTWFIRSLMRVCRLKYRCGTAVGSAAVDTLSTRPAQGATVLDVEILRRAAASNALMYASMQAYSAGTARPTDVSRLAAVPWGRPQFVT